MEVTFSTVRGLMTGQLAHAARPGADAHQAAHLSRRQGPPRSAHLGPQGLHHEHHDVQQFAGAGDVLGALTAGEQAIVADAVEACGQHVHEKAADELVGGERHHLIAFAPFEPVVLPLEGDALVIEREQAAVGDGDPVGVAGEIAQHLLRTAEGALAIDHPLFAVQRPQIRGERLRIDQPGMLAEELQLTGLISGTELVQEQPAEQLREHGYRQEEARPA